MFTGHASHQVGLDADIWLTPMPNRQLSRNEREEMSAVMMVRGDRLDIDPKVFTPGHLAVIRAAALEPTVQRIFVNAAIKKALCREAKGDRSWLSKVRPMYGHDYHFHIRIKCPPGTGECESQPDPAESEGCKPADLAYWFKDLVLHPKPPQDAAETKAADDDGVAAGGLQSGARGPGREAIEAAPTKCDGERDEDLAPHCLNGFCHECKRTNSVCGNAGSFDQGAFRSADRGPRSRSPRDGPWRLPLN